MDEIFGINRFIAQLIWKSRQNKDNRNITNVSIDHEYILCYGEGLKGSERNASQYSNPDNDPRGVWASANMVGLATKDKRPNLHYDLIDPQTGINYGCPFKGWRYDIKSMSRLIQESKIIWPSNPSGRPRKKQFLSELNEKNTGFSSIVGENYYTRDGTKEQMSIFGKVVFDFPKNTGLIQELLNQVLNDDDIVLDSFAGSGTTAHAVLNLNALDLKRYRFILVETMDYAEMITAERVKRVISGYSDTPGIDSDFSYYELGEQLLTEDHLLNEDVGIEKIREYILYMETNKPFVEPIPDNMSFIGSNDTTAYYFHYDKNESTVLDDSFISTLENGYENHVIYADTCTIPVSVRKKFGIVFKKIPRDIERL